MEQAESQLLEILIKRSYLYRPERPFVLVDRDESGGRARIEAALVPQSAVFSAIFTRADVDRAWKAGASGR